MTKTYSHAEALKASLDYFGNDELAAKVFVDKYALKDLDGNYYEKTPEDMHHRLAKEFARIESKYPNPLSEEQIFDYLHEFKWIVPQGSPMSAIGNNFQIQTLGNCYVLEPPLDSYGGILKSDQELAQLMKRRAGVGVSLDNLRPEGLPTKNAAKTTDGIGVFMERFSNTCREVAQRGRRGAEMQMLSVHHPDIETFITIKKDRNKVTGSNLSVKLTDEFMIAVTKNAEYEQRWPVDSETPVVSKKVSAKKVWDMIIEAAWESAEPGLFFIDNQVKYTPADIYASVDKDWLSTCTNPCGEIGMGVDSCRLMVVNLFSFVVNPYTDDAYFDYDKLKEVSEVAQKLMDDVVDLELEKMDKIIAKIDSDPEREDVKKIEKDLWLRLRKNCEAGRRTGLGITGLGDALAAVGIRYGSEESVKTVEEMYKTLTVSAFKSSAKMAKDRGAFPLYDADLEKGHPYVGRVLDADLGLKRLHNKHGRRNIALTTTAPTGSVSILTQTTSGIEPAFLLEYDRFKKVNPNDEGVVVHRVDQMGDAWQKFKVYHHNYKTWMDISGKKKVEESPYHKATSADVDWLSGVNLQAAAQKWICHSISRTANIPNDASPELVSKIYMEAWKSGCKGYTVYRDGCRDGVLVSSTVEDTDQDGRPTTIVTSNSPKRPEELPADIMHATVKGVKWTILVGLLNGEPYEMFMGKAEQFKIPSKFVQGKLVRLKSGVYNLLDLTNVTLVKDVIKTADNNESAWTTRMMSMSLRHGIPIEYLVDQLSKDGSIVDVTNVLARLLRKYNKKKEASTEKCPQCGSNNPKFEDGCSQCLDCGFSGCN